MSPVTHFLSGWVLASAFSRQLGKSGKIIVVLASVAPDIDGLGIIPELLTRNSSHPLLWFSEYHHSLHNLAFALLCTVAAFLVLRNTTVNRWFAALMVFLSFHLHLLCDLVGARGPDGYQWPIPYLKPFSNSVQLTWSHQWILNGWQNFVITSILLFVALWIAWRRGESPLQFASERADRALTQALRTRFSR
jgi:inner membrane protein